MNRHYPIQGQLAQVIHDQVRRSLDALALTVFLPEKHGWRKPATEVLGAAPLAIFAEIGLDLTWYTHTVLSPGGLPPAATGHPELESFAINVVLRGAAEIQWAELAQGVGRYGERDVFIMDLSAPHTIRGQGSNTVMGSFTPASATSYESAMLMIRSWIRSKQR